MNNDNDNEGEQFFEELAKLYPELMEKSEIGEHIGVDSGWFPIIDVLCGCIYSKLQHAKSKLAAATQYPRDDGNAYLNLTTQEVADELEALPVIAQIKEKFGTLRFYVHNGSDRVYDLIDFAEGMSAVTCEVCGKPGTLDKNSGWVKTHCIEHRHPERNSRIPSDGKISAAIDDENA